MILKKSKLPKRAKKTAATPRSGVAQSWLPVQDISGGMLIRADGTPVAVIRIEAAPFALLSGRERKRRIEALREVIQMLPGQAQIFCLPRPIDLDAYITSLEALQTEANSARRTQLRGYISYIRSLAVSAAAIEHRYYILLPGEKGRKDARGELAQKTTDLVAALKRADLQAYACNDQEALDLLFIFFNPAQAAFERVSMRETIMPSLSFEEKGGTEQDGVS